MKKKHTQQKSARRKNQGGFGIKTPSSWLSPVAYTVACNIIKLAEKRYRRERLA